MPTFSKIIMVTQIFPKHRDRRSEPVRQYKVQEGTEKGALEESKGGLVSWDARASSNRLVLDSPREAHEVRWERNRFGCGAHVEGEKVSSVSPLSADIINISLYF